MAATHSAELSSSIAYPVDSYAAYDRLPEGAIRLLLLHAGEKNQPIDCRTITAILESDLNYEALSYAWGTSHGLKSLVLNGNVCQTRHNLVDCLHDLRQHDSSRVLWIDALCINQVDVEEKSAQVALMPRIYRSASRTLIWLRDDQVHCDDEVFDYISVPRSTEDETIRKPRYSESLHYLDQLALGGHLEYNEEIELMVEGLEVISKFSWWSRVWVVQETLLSPSADIIIGNSILSWSTAFQAATNFVSHATTCCLVHKTDRSMSDVARFVNDTMGKVAGVILSFQTLPPGMSNELLANLWMFRNRLASLEHDKVYGILGMIKSEPTTVRPDYRLSFSDICSSILLEDIRTSGNLHALRGIRTTRSTSEVPSWCVDWSDLDYWAEDRPRILTELYKRIYSASGAHVARIASPDTIPRSLGVAGHIFDQVRQVSPPLEFDPHYQDASEIEELISLLSWRRKYHANPTYVTGGSSFLAFCKTLLGDCVLPYSESQDLFHNVRSTGSDKPILSIRRTVPSDILPFLLWLDTNKRVREADLTLRSEIARRTASDETYDRSARLTRMAEGLKRLPALVNIQASIARATSGRRMFITRGGYIGLGPACTDKGSYVAMLLGGTTPFMLRDTTSESSSLISPEDMEFEQRYCLLGDCYVHGCMDGELVKDGTTDNWPMVVLV